MYSGIAAGAAESRKDSENDIKCAELSWKCIPLVVENYGAWVQRLRRLSHKQPLI